jgi:hypothetical protein
MNITDHQRTQNSWYCADCVTFDQEIDLPPPPPEQVRGPEGPRPSTPVSL